MPAAWKTNFLAASWLAAALVGAEPQQPTTSLTSEVAHFSHPTYPKGDDEHDLPNLVVPRQVDIQVPGIQNTPLPLPIPVEVEVAVETNEPAAQTDTGAPIPDAQETEVPAETNVPAVETVPVARYSC
ncbi:uncharacterized protein FTOL_00353 [Fusarium torulosum]|uniref:Uncharacterized protein n=1 Tax=Fusarium torulosum TaxID=33205 RepID=A0AAE8LY00_9HYPO|nr:uncharacterized protein FTOL_00353 [Fusarium torulosum]